MGACIHIYTYTYTGIYNPSPSIVDTLSYTTTTMSELLEYTFKNITYSTAYEFARIQTDAFRDDVLMNALHPKEECFTADALPSIADTEKLRAKLDQYEKLVRSAARRVHQDVASNPRHRLFLLPDGNGKLVAGTYWVLPKYLNLPKPNLYQRLKNFLRGLLYRTIDYFAFFKSGAPFGEGPYFVENDWGKNATRALDNPEREKELVNSNPKELQETSYPKNLTYYLFIMCVRTDEHGKGYGKKLINSSLARLGPYERPPHIYGPPKASLMSAPTARGFYLACDWEVGAVAERPLPNGVPGIHTFFFKNLD